ncbi:MAG: Uncharacterized protein G01um101416_736 [Microgenomates group bacterium Gr01-1014_16]|nr:MAG: Uncharacterized protein G01um101416_736 [Microgenomates group bacterium Gr01-1014_16]
MKLFVTRKIPFWEEVSKPLLDAGYEITVYPNNRRIERGELVAELEKGYEGLLCLLTEKIDEELLLHAGNLKIVANYAVGFDNIDVPACQRKNIMVTNTPSDKVNESVAEHAWALMLALTRRIVEAHEFMRNAAYEGWEPEIFVGQDMVDKTLGIVGMGRIGSMVAKRAEGWGMKVVSAGKEGSLEDLLKQSDYVSLHVPLTAETKHLINAKNLPLFKKTAFLINTARGPVVDEVEVVEALRAGIIAGYGTDVYENEPHPNPEMLGLPNVVMTPHIASATVAARRDMGEIAVRNLVEGLVGRVPPNLVR